MENDEYLNEGIFSDLLSKVKNLVKNFLPNESADYDVLDDLDVEVPEEYLEEENFNDKIIDYIVKYLKTEEEYDFD
jgi:hypothetical protein